MKNIKKVLSVLLVMALACSLCVTAFAAEATIVDSKGSVAADITNETKVGQDTNQSKASEYETVNKGSLSDKTVDVYVTQAPTYSVMIPKTVVLDGGTGVGNYTVQVMGDIEGKKQITVEPAASVTLSQTGKDDIAAAITQTKTAWDYKDIVEGTFEGGKTGTGTITVALDDLSAGSWSGSFLMHISYDDLVATDYENN